MARKCLGNGESLSLECPTGGRVYVTGVRRPSVSAFSVDSCLVAPLEKVELTKKFNSLCQFSTRCVIPLSEVTDSNYPSDETKFLIEAQYECLQCKILIV